jgi:hypothetical protein
MSTLCHKNLLLASYIIYGNALITGSEADQLMVYGRDSMKEGKGRLFRLRGNQMLPTLELGKELGREPHEAVYLSLQN